MDIPLNEKPWIGVDLDGTLAYWDIAMWEADNTWIGDPIPRMMERVKEWVSKGYRVKIFTARAGTPAGENPVLMWLRKHGLGQLEITNVKDYLMVELWDDRAVQVVRNTGIRVDGSSL